MTGKAALLLIVALLGLAAAAMLGAVATGSESLSFAEIVSGLRGNDEGLAGTLVRELRLPRALAAFATGGLLALAGVFMQVLLRNPLADPYILGVSGGAAVAALGAMTAGLSGLWIDSSAFGGALAATFTVFALARGEGGWTPVRLLLTGVVLAAGMGALISLLLALGSDSSLRGMLFWLMGDLSFAGPPLVPLTVLAIATVLGLTVARPLNVLSRGDSQAAVLGVEVTPLRLLVFVVSSLITAVAVTTAGSIGFVGLVVPHLVRQVSGFDHRVVIPASVLFGGSLLVFADTLARTVVAPRQLPVGALTAFIGVPLFLLLMRRQR